MPSRDVNPEARDAASPAATPPQIQRIELAELPPPGASQHGAGTPLVPSLNPLHRVKTTLQVHVGTATLTVGELLSAQAQQVLVLDRGVEQPVDLVLEGQVVARGQLVAVGDRFAVRLTELPTPLGLMPRAAP
ncbi:FliM/FliN family flagellar motor switch protein [Paracidovorax anthurii]|uniref:FliM/FliN family flagellar motor switch protein n=1 Tax=Paracidovorax anthurii TaxID=78229 RepID=UPI000DCFBBB5|nr:FliM/FliN family flagellar motor switch protein [Paracidovorax anthurii]